MGKSVDAGIVGDPGKTDALDSTSSGAAATPHPDSLLSAHTKPFLTYFTQQQTTSAKIKNYSSQTDTPKSAEVSAFQGMLNKQTQILNKCIFSSRKRQSITGALDYFYNGFNSDDFYPPELKEQLSIADMNKILIALSHALDGELGKEIANLKDGEELYLKKSEVRLLDVELPRTIVINKTDGKLSLSVETKTKTKYHTDDSPAKKEALVRIGGTKKVKPSWLLSDEGFKKQAKATVSLSTFFPDYQPEDTRHASEAQLQEYKDFLYEQLGDEVRIPCEIGDPALGGYGSLNFHEGKNGLVATITSPYLENELFDLFIERTEEEVAAGHKQPIAMSDTDIKSASTELLRGLARLHDAGYSHNDIKPENIMFEGDTKRPVIIDFGLVGKPGRPENQICSTLLYTPPEKVFLYTHKYGNIGLTSNMADRFYEMEYSQSEYGSVAPWQVQEASDYIKKLSEEDDKVCRTGVGMTHYDSMLEKHAYSNQSNDCWAMGMCLLQLYCKIDTQALGEKMLEHNSFAKIMDEYQIPADSPERAAVLGLLNPDPSKRLSSKEALTLVAPGLPIKHEAASDDASANPFEVSRRMSLASNPMKMRR